MQGSPDLAGSSYDDEFEAEIERAAKRARGEDASGVLHAGAQRRGAGGGSAAMPDDDFSMTAPSAYQQRGAASRGRGAFGGAGGGVAAAAVGSARLPATDLDDPLADSAPAALGGAVLNPWISRLHTAIGNEKLAPELLPYEHKVVTEVALCLGTQNTSLATPEARREVSRVCANATSLALYHMDIDRVRYMLAAYHRTRLAKIQKWAYYFMTPTGEQEAITRMCSEEQEFWRGYLSLKGGHLYTSTLSKLPPAEAALSVEVEPRLGTGPDLRRHVYARVMVPDLGELPPPSWSTDLTPLSLVQGDGKIISYAWPGLPDLVHQGKVELG